MRALASTLTRSPQTKGPATRRSPDKRPILSVYADFASAPSASASTSAWAGHDAAIQDGPRSASSASRHSTSSRTDAPPEKVSMTTPDGASVSENSTASRLRTASLRTGINLPTLAGQHALEAQGCPPPLVFRLGALRALPVEPIKRDHDALFLRTPQDVGYLDHRVLQVGRSDLEIFFVENHEFQRVHWRSRSPPGVIRQARRTAQDAQRSGNAGSSPAAVQRGRVAGSVNLRRKSTARARSCARA